MTSGADVAVETGADATAQGGVRTGILPVQEIGDAIQAGMIAATAPITDAQMQPASLDLRLGTRAWRVQSSFLPGMEMSVADKLARLAMHQIDLTGGAVLERGCVYIVELQESLRLEKGLSAMANPKSSTGRLDIFTRLITDRALEFEAVGAGYHGPLYAEISPRTFSVLVRPGSCLSQLRLRRGPAAMSDDAMIALQRDVGLVRGAEDVDIRDGVALGVNLTPTAGDGIIGWRARKHAGLIDIDAPASCEVDAFWERLTTADLVAGGLVLHPDEFYILASREYVTVPRDHAAEMRAYDTRVGEFRAHYAGFFDPGFGMAELGAGATRAVLEVRSHDVPFLIEEGQTICRLVYEPMAAVPGSLYGAGGSGSNYQSQGLRLAKHFIQD
ncbi:MAG: 2'-deoxycytidine 5'-triphosphate deaminase [Pseudomonadota bacterium]|nr:2'-deoxycytidine 5'-triphosphate deaminase [Pseudomonadota bacterium]